MSDVLGIVIAYKHFDVVTKCAQHILKQDYKADWLIWDNGSHLGLQDKIKPWPELSLIESPENILWTPALNAAISYSLKPEHQYILYMNHDVMLPTNAVSKMKRLLESYSDAGAVAPVGPAMGGLQDRASHLSDYGDKSHIRSSYLMGAVQMMKREVWETVGPFDDLMSLGADDFDYSIRMKEAGYSLWVLPKLVVDHIGHVTGQSPEWNEYGGKSWARFNEKYDGYYKDEAEAIGSLWGSFYNDKYPVGTGISEEEKIRRGIKNA